MLWFVPLLLASAIEAPAPAPAPAGAPAVRRLVTAFDAAAVTAALTAPGRRVRATNERMATLLASGVQRSRTFADLVMQLHRSDVIVYVETTFALPPGTNGRLFFQDGSGSSRYLRVQVLTTLSRDDMIGVIAHELRHALEVAADRSVVNSATLMALYTRIGHLSAGTQSFDTDAANVTGRQVRSELAA